MAKTGKPSRAPIDPVLAILAHAEPHILEGENTEGDESARIERAHDAALMLAVSTPATTLQGLAGQVAALSAVIDWNEAGEDANIYTKAHLETSARLVASFIASAVVTLAKMGAAPPPVIALYGMTPSLAARVSKIAAQATRKGADHA